MKKNIVMQVKRIISFFSKGSDAERWKNLANHDKAWTERAKRVAGFIQEAERVIEFGAGRCHLRDFLPKNASYTPADIVSREEGCFVVDLNKLPYEKFPEADVAVFNGVIEYVYDVPALINHLKDHYNSLVVTYADIGEGKPRRLKRLKRNGWVNAFTRRRFLSYFTNKGYVLQKEDKWERQGIYRLVINKL